MELSNKQEEIVKTTYPYVIVIASAASGKTRTLTARIDYLIDSGIDPTKIVAITFTNLAAEEIRERLGAKAKNCFIGTVHSYCNHLLTTGGVDTKSLLKEEKFDELFNLIQNNSDCVREVDHLLLDEAQDSSRPQFEFFLKTIKPKNFMFFGDYRQEIYMYAGSAGDMFVNMTHNNEIKVYDLNENYRNKKEISEYAKMIIRQNGMEYIDKSIPMRGTGGRVVTVEYSPKAIASTILKMGNYKDWFILSRWNRDIYDIAAALEDMDVPYAIIRKKDFSTNNELRTKMKENSVKIMTIHQSKGLEAPNVVVIGANFNGNGTVEKRSENNCVNYVAATRAKDLLVWTYKHKYQKKTLRSFE